MVHVFDPGLAERQPTATALLSAAVERDRLAHAYLLTGGNTDDKLLIARQVACYLNCKSTERDTRGSCQRQSGQTAGYCQNCRWILEDKHPQAWLSLGGASERSASGKISVERARELADELSKTSTSARVVVIEDASQDIFHRPAANALLKTIEEPRGTCIFFLFSRSEDHVLTTIVSRCQILPVTLSGRSLEGPLSVLSGGGGHDQLFAFAQGLDEETRQKLDALKKHKFFQDYRSWHLAHSQEEPSKSAHHVASALSLADLLFHLSDDADPALVIDSALLTELEIIGNSVPGSPKLSRYVA